MSRKERMEKLLKDAFSPHHLEIHDESFMHHVPKDGETHFKLIIVADNFNDLNHISRHRLVNKLLAEELATGLHALSLHLYTQLEWEEKDKTVLKSPSCKDGYRHG